MRRRKLMPLAKLEELFLKCKEGVPLATLVNRQELDMSRPALAKLLKVYEERDNCTVRSAIAPAWLDQDGDDVQEQPDNYVYLGTFPNGEWYEVN